MSGSGEYISRDQVFAIVCEDCNKVFPDEPCEPSDCELLNALRSIPAAGVRPVVLCRDCIFRSNEWTGCPKLNGTITGDEFFCKCGIKRRRKADGT